MIEIKKERGAILMSMGTDNRCTIKFLQEWNKVFQGERSISILAYIFF
jgi:hypothetical protein